MKTQKHKFHNLVEFNDKNTHNKKKVNELFN